MIMRMTQVTQKWRQSSILVHHTHYYMILRERGICGTFDWVSSRIIWGITVSSPRPSQQKGILMGFLSSTFGPGIIPLRTYTQQGGAPSGRPSETLWEKTGGGTDSPPGSQVCDHPSGCPDRQHALFMHTLQVKEVRAPMLAVLSTDSAQEKQLLNKHL